MSSVSYKGFEPMQDRVLVQPNKPEVKTAGGIIIPESMQKPIPGGVIKAIGPDVGGAKAIIDQNPLDIGDKVLYGEHAGFPVVVDGEDMILMRASDIFARTGVDIDAMLEPEHQTAS